MIVENTCVSYFCKLPHSVIKKGVLLFLSEHEIANWGICCKIFSNIQKEHSKWIIEINENAWKKIVESEGRIVKLSSSASYFRMVNGHIIFTAEIGREFLNLKTLQIHSDLIKEGEKLIEGGSIDEPYSAMMNTTFMYRLTLIDNENMCTSGVVEFSTPYSRKIPILGTNKKMNDCVEFTTIKGTILQKLFNTSKIESNQKEIKEIRCVPECIPIPDLNTSNSNRYQRCANRLYQAFKINNFYYFQWKIEKDRPNDYQYPITMMKDINLPKDHIELQTHSQVCAADDHFFYASLENKITVYKGSTVWKKIYTEWHHLHTIRLFPSPCGLVVTNSIVNARELLQNSLTLWDHRKYLPTNKDEFTPLMKIELSIKNPSPFFVTKDLLIYDDDKIYTIYHIPSLTTIGTFKIPGMYIKDIIASGDPFPKYLVAYCVGFSNIGRERRQNNHYEFRVFSLENNKSKPLA